MNYLKEATQYARDVIQKKIVAGIYTQKACKRFIDDIKLSKNTDFQYEINVDYVNTICTLAETIHIPDIGGTMKLLGWQIFVYTNLIGWVHKDNPKQRRFRQAYIEVARKNGKTTGLLFPLILYDFLTTNSAEAYLVSRDLPLSDKTFRELKQIINADPALKKACTSTISAIVNGSSRIAFFAAESVGIDGYRNSMSVIDEFWSYPDDKIVTAFRYGGRARETSQVIIITSAGLDISGACYAENQKCKNVLNKILVDEQYFGCIYAYDEKDDWKDPKNFIKANPSLGAILKEDVLQADLSDAILTPSHQPDFKSKTCGFWTGDTVSWIPMQKWDDCGEKINIKKLDIIPSVLGLDLSSVSDFTALTKCSKINNRYLLEHNFFIPEETLYEKYKKDNINILDWVNKGLVKTINGAIIDLDYIFTAIEEEFKKGGVMELIYDPWQAGQLITKLEEKYPNINYIPFSQGLKTMSPASKNFERLVLDKKIIDSNPVMRWMVSNAKIKPTVNGDYKPLKETRDSTKRIDGVISSIIALARIDLAEQPEQKSFSKVLNSF